MTVKIILAKVLANMARSCSRNVQIANLTSHSSPFRSSNSSCSTDNTACLLHQAACTMQNHALWAVLLISSIAERDAPQCLSVSAPSSLPAPACG